MSLPTPKEGESRQHFTNRCMDDPKVKKLHPNTEERLAMLDSQFRRGNPGEIKAPVRGLSVLAQADVGAIRSETVDGKLFTVVPVVALVEGVLWPSNAPNPELALASEFGKFNGAGWNGRPIVLGHPERNGMKVSANNPEVLSDEEFGQIFNARLDDKKLKLEAWFDMDRVKALDGKAQSSVKRMLDGELVEVSTGLLAEIELIEGEHNGEEFFGVWRSIVPDHLAILPEGIKGACSIADGCGAPRVNTEGNLRCQNCDGNCACQNKWEVFSKEKMPLETEEAKKPKTESLFARVLEFAQKADFLHLFTVRDSAELSDRDIRIALEAALNVVLENTFADVLAVFSDRFVYGTWEGLFMRSFSIAEDGAVTLGDEPVQVIPRTEFVPVSVTEGERSMTLQERVSALIANERTKFTEDNRKWLEGLKEEEIALIEPTTAEANIETATKKATDDAAKAAEDASVATLNAANAVVEAAARTETAKKAEEAAVIVAEAVAKTREVDAAKLETTKVEPRTVEDFIKEAPPEVAAVLSEGISLQKEKREHLTAGLKANAANEYSDEELAKMPLPDLERIAKLARVPDYSGSNGGARVLQDDSDQPDPPPQAFPIETTKAA